MGKSFINELVDFMESGPLIAIICEGDNVIKTGRKLMGETNPVFIFIFL